MSRSSMHKRFHVEALEDRTAPAVGTPVLNAGVLTITADGAADTVTITQNDPANHLRVSVGTGPYVTYDYYSSAVQTITVDMGGGADVLKYRLSPGADLTRGKVADFTLGGDNDVVEFDFLEENQVPTLYSSLTVNIWGNEGEDRLEADFGKKSGGALNVTADMGSEDDTVILTQQGDIVRNADVRFLLQGGAGDDDIFVSCNIDSPEHAPELYISPTSSLTVGITGDDNLDTSLYGRVWGELDIWTRGNGDNDHVDIFVDLENGSFGSVDVRAYGDDGSDRLTMRVRNTGWASLFLYINGGLGFDISRRTSNVPATNVFNVENDGTVP